MRLVLAGAAHLLSRHASPEVPIQYEQFRYDTSYARQRPRTNWFAWTLAMLLLAAFALVAWLGSFYIFWQPERPDSYRLLRKLHRIDPPRRFELTAAPPGEFLTPTQLHDRFTGLGTAEMVKVNSELARKYIRNVQQVHGLVPYVVGRFRIIDVHQLGPADIFTSGMVALASAIDNGELVLEHGHETPATTPVDGDIDTILSMPSESPWPITLAFVTTIGFALVLSHHLIGAGIMAALAAAVLAAWHSREPEPA